MFYVILEDIGDIEQPPSKYEVLAQSKSLQKARLFASRTSTLHFDTCKKNATKHVSLISSDNPGKRLPYRPSNLKYSDEFGLDRTHPLFRRLT